MKTLLIIDETTGIPRAWLARTLLNQAASQMKLQITHHPSEAQLVILIGTVRTEQAALQDKLVYVGQLNDALRQPGQFLQTAQTHCQPASELEDKLSAPPATAINTKHLVAVTACPTGVAHTFMSAEAIEQEAKRRGWCVKVETRGSVGAGNVLTEQDISKADLVLIAADIEVDLAKFAGKPLYRTSTGRALKKTAEELDNATSQAQIWQSKANVHQSHPATKKSVANVYRHLLTGVSYMLPMVVAGGLCIALSFVFGINAFETPGTLPAALMQIGGQTAFALMVPILAGYIAFSIADRPGLTPGLIGGMIASTAGAGFIGGIIAGFLAGYVVKAINHSIRLPASMGSLKPILIIPLLASLITGLAMIYIISPPVAQTLNHLTVWLKTMETANAALLGALLGGMMCTDMGGPVNKAAYAFGVGMLSSQVYTPIASIMAAGMVPPLALGVATLVARRKFDAEQREGGKVALVLGSCFITEGAIPFAARDPVRVLPCCIIGGAVTGAISMAIGAKLMAPHGGVIAMLIPGVITPLAGYLLAIIAGSLLAGLGYALVKPQEQPVS